MHRVSALQTPFTTGPVCIAAWTPETQRDPLRLVVGGTSWLDLFLANGQRIRVRPLPEGRRWRRHDGGDRPVPPRTLVDVRLRNGRELRNVKRSGLWEWGANGRSSDIMAWRPAR